MHPAVAVGLVFGGCCSNVVFLELLARCGAGERLWGQKEGLGAGMGWGGSGEGPRGWQGRRVSPPPASGPVRGGSGSDAQGVSKRWGVGWGGVL